MLAVVPGLKPSITKKARTKAKGNENYWQTHPCCLCPHQIMSLRVTKVQGQLLHQCHQGLIDLEVPGIHTTANEAAGSPEAI